MGKAEKLLIALVVALVGFVGVQVSRAPKRVAKTAPAPSQQGDTSTTVESETVAAPARQPVPPAGNDMLNSLRSSLEPPPMRDLVEIKSKLVAGASGTYISDLLAAQDSMVYRWPDRRVTGIRVWVDTPRGMNGWNDGFADMARRVFTEWGSAGSSVRFEFIVDSVSSDIRVHWIPTFGTRQIGSATRLIDQSSWILGADLKIAIFDSTGRAFSPVELTGIVRHEVGHALGLGHSGDRRTLMFPEETMYDIAPADQATLRLIYTLPPGATNK